MEELLKKFNYKSETENVWIKNVWTVRFDDNVVEVFNDPEGGKGMYYCELIQYVDLEQILEEIDEFLIKDAFGQVE